MIEFKLTTQNFQSVTDDNLYFVDPRGSSSFYLAVKLAFTVIFSQLEKISPYGIIFTEMCVLNKSSVLNEMRGMKMSVIQTIFIPCTRQYQLR